MATQPTPLPRSGSTRPVLTLWATVVAEWYGSTCLPAAIIARTQRPTHRPGQFAPSARLTFADALHRDSEAGGELMQRGDIMRRRLTPGEEHLTLMRVEDLWHQP